MTCHFYKIILALLQFFYVSNVGYRSRVAGEDAREIIKRISLG